LLISTLPGISTQYKKANGGEAIYPEDVEDIKERFGGIFDGLTDEIKAAEARMKEISELRTQIFNLLAERIFRYRREGDYLKTGCGE
jgi:hypothetical protein